MAIGYTVVCVCFSALICNMSWQRSTDAIDKDTRGEGGGDIEGGGGGDIECEMDEKKTKRTKKRKKKRERKSRSKSKIIGDIKPDSEVRCNDDGMSESNDDADDGERTALVVKN